MTTIAYDGVTLAADRMATSGHLKHTTTKIHRFNNIRMGTCGDLRAGVALIEWAKNGFVPEEFPEIAGNDEDPTFLLVIKDEELGVILYEGTPTPIHFEDPYFAMGSGSHIATAAMALGKSAEEAVQLAEELTTGSGRGVDYLD